MNIWSQASVEKKLLLRIVVLILNTCLCLPLSENMSSSFTSSSWTYYINSLAMNLYLNLTVIAEHGIWFRVYQMLWVASINSYHLVDVPIPWMQQLYIPQRLERSRWKPCQWEMPERLCPLPTWWPSANHWLRFGVNC